MLELPKDPVVTVVAVAISMEVIGFIVCNAILILITILKSGYKFVTTEPYASDDEDDDDKNDDGERNPCLDEKGDNKTDEDDDDDTDEDEDDDNDGDEKNEDDNEEDDEKEDEDDDDTDEEEYDDVESGKKRPRSSKPSSRMGSFFIAASRKVSYYT